MNIIFYCQYVWGMGHLVRSLEFARALSGHNVTLIAGGQKVEVDLPDHVQLVRLPVLYMDEKFTRLIPGDPGRSLEQIQQERKNTLYSLLEKEQPDLFIVELYPFGRSIFGFELEPLLADMRAGQFGHVKAVCSLRDILVEKKDPPAYEERVLGKLNRYFDALLVHSDAGLLRLDETFTRVGDINIPLVYTGFITQHATPGAGSRMRRELKISPDQKLIVASAGGGRSGYRLLTSVIDACELLRERLPFRLEVFSGPFMDNEEYKKLSVRAASGFRIRRYTKRFLDYLSAADLSISLAGYNTCMNLLVTKVPCLVFPYWRQQEQPMRADKIKKYLPMKVLKETEMQPASLSRHIAQMLQQNRVVDGVPIDLDGAANAARFLNQMKSS
ncbi:MAG: glycosyl transferase [Deltaproteobacteria bacterium]|nr:glycosyl transferase [Deltaproteobacteria bacterium]